MKPILHLLLLIPGLLIEGNQAEDFNLHFHQHDYRLKFERFELTRYNKDLVRIASIVTFKYNRTLAVVNGTFNFKVDLGEDMVAVVQVYKFMSNEYRPFPIRFAANCCKALAADVAGMSGLSNCGNFTKCPLEKGITYHVCNWYPDPSKFPPLIPNGQFRIEMQMFYFSTEVSLTNAYVTIDRPIV